MTNVDTRTAAVALQVFGATQEGGAIPVYGQMMAAALVCAVPVVVLYLRLPAIPDQWPDRRVE